MKHPLQQTILLVALFLVAQAIGLAIINEYIDIHASHESGMTVKNDDIYKRIGFEPPQIQNESLSFIYILVSVFIGTAIILLIIKFKKGNLWKIWYFIAVLVALAVAINPFVFKIPLLDNMMGVLIVGLIALVLSFLKVVRPNIYVHNFTEILIYGGIAALLVPIMDLFSGIVLLVLISIYDAYAVWKSKHMITMAEFQKTTNLFAGLSLPYSRKELENKDVKKSVKKETPNGTPSDKTAAILGGGDIAFPLLFSGVVMKLTGSYWFPALISLGAALALFLLLAKAEKGKFYPAMPFISAGCFAGLIVSWAISNVIVIK
jgi:presenilin-like A22 family membrane protease